MTGFDFDAAMGKADRAIIGALKEDLIFPDVGPDPVSAGVDLQNDIGDDDRPYSYYSVLVATSDVPGACKGMAVLYNGKAHKVADIQRSGSSWEMVIV